MQEVTAIYMESKNKLIFIGGIKIKENNKKNISRNYKQGYRIYDSKGIIQTIMAEGSGIGRNGGLYLIYK